MLQYLFAALSCKKQATEGVSEEDLELIRQWEARILAIARDEMAHFATAGNLITTIGGSPYFNRPNFPQTEHRWFPFSFQLERLNTECVERFVRAESPKPTVFAEAIAPEPIEFDYVGELYGLIASGFEFLVKMTRAERSAVKETSLLDGLSSGCRHLERQSFDLSDHQSFFG